jgi:predicted neutral ceramidase superfamily lipid hydrolase
LRILALKEIYYRCWQILENSHITSGFFLLTYFIGYVGQIIYITFFFLKQAILEEKFAEKLFDNVLWLSVLNVFSIAFFIASHKIYSKGLKISGLIHEIAHNAIKDNQLVEAVKLFSIQISQQPMTHINIFGIFYYDRSNINGVRIFLMELKVLKK